MPWYHCRFSYYLLVKNSVVANWVERCHLIDWGIPIIKTSCENGDNILWSLPALSRNIAQQTFLFCSYCWCYTSEKCAGELFCRTRQIWGIWKLRPAYSPETPNLGQSRWCFVPCDLEILWMTLEKNRASLFCCFKLCATFHSHRWIQTGVTVRKRPIWVKFDDF